MKREMIAWLCATVVCMFGVVAVASPVGQPPASVLVRLDAQEASRSAGLGIFRVERLARWNVAAEGVGSSVVEERLSRVARVVPVGGSTYADVVAALPEEWEVLGIEAVGELHGGTDDLDPVVPAVVSDPFFEEQYGLFMGAGGVDAVTAWGFLAAPEREIVVAVIDAGVSATHPDLVDRLVTGYNAIDGSSMTDDGKSSHGTHVAGIAAAHTDNGIGIAGVAPYARIMPVTAFYSNGFGLEGWVAAGIKWAVDNGADVINMSFGFRSESGALSEALTYAYEHGVVCVASTGNVPTQAIGLPARKASVIGVGAIGADDQLWPNTSIGEGLAVVAPGEAVLSTWDTPTDPATYREESGTSMAAPYVAGIAALMLAVEPTLSVDEVWSTLAMTADDLGDPAMGFGRVNALVAVAEASTLRAAGCAGDFNQDGFRDSSDIQEFVAAYLAEDPRVDVAVPFGQLDLLDIQRFIDLYFIECE